MRSLYYVGLLQDGEFRLDGGSEKAKATRQSDGKLIAEWVDPVIEVNDARKTYFKRVSRTGAIPFKRIKISTGLDCYLNKDDVEQIRIESEAYSPYVWVSNDADLDCLPILMILSRYLQLSKSEESNVYIP